MKRLVIFFVLCAVAMLGGQQYSAYNMSSTSLPVAPLTGTTGSIGGGVLIAGAANTTTVTVAGATTGQTCSVSAQGGVDIGVGAAVQCWVSSANTVTVRETAIIGLTPAASTFRVTVQ